MKLTIKPGLYGVKTKRNDAFVRADVILLPQYIKKGIFWLPAAFQKEHKPRYLMPIPIQFLSDVGLLLLAAYEYGFQGYEYPSRCFLDEHLAPGDIFIDVGCHWGIFSLHAATVNPGQNRVIAMDPLPQNANSVQQWLNVNRLQSSIQMIEAAAASENSTANFSYSHSMGGKLLPANMNKKARQIEVKTIRLDSLPDIKLNQHSLILKIDVEGGEYSVLTGCKRLLEEGNIKAIIWEYSQPHVLHDSKSHSIKAVELLTGYGYEHFVFAHHHMAGPLIPFAPVAGVYNVISVPVGFDLRHCYGRYSEKFAPLTPPFYSDLSPENMRHQAQQIMSHHSSEGTRWRDLSLIDSGAKQRATIAASYIKGGNSVLDMGAGEQWLKKMLSSTLKYYPVDFVPQSHDCIILDLNQDFYPEVGTDWVVFLNILEFLHHMGRTLKTASRYAKNMVLSYDLGENQEKDRKIKGYFNNYTKAQLVEIIEESRWQITHTRQENETVYFICAASSP